MAERRQLTLADVQDSSIADIWMVRIGADGRLGSGARRCAKKTSTLLLSWARAHALQTNPCAHTRSASMSMCRPRSSWVACWCARAFGGCCRGECACL